jgi:predicted methyltransferase MtxX (methanogen marker protein 4)
MSDLSKVFSLKEIMRVAVLGDPAGKPLLLAPVGIDEGKDMMARLEIVRSAVVYFSPMGWSPSIGVLSKGRIDDIGRGDEIRTSLADGEKLIQKLRGDGLDATHYSILVEEAARACDMVVAPDGVSGNLIFRALHFLGSWRAYGAPVLNLTKVFVDTSRAKADFSDSVLMAAGLAEARRVRRIGP